MSSQTIMLWFQISDLSKIEYSIFFKNWPQIVSDIISVVTLYVYIEDDRRKLTKNLLDWIEISDQDGLRSMDKKYETHFDASPGLDKSMVIFQCPLFQKMLKIREI